MNKQIEYYAKQGFEHFIKSLGKRLEALIHLHIKGQYPVIHRMVGFPKLHVRNQTEMLARIQELTDILALKATRDKQ